jgi:hypothetical protein
MDDFNPYAPPKSAELDEARVFDHANVAWRDGKLLMVHKDAILPDRCLKCNEPAEGYQYQRSVTWLSPYYALLLLLSPPLYILAFLFMSRRGKVTAGVCRLHRKKRRTAILAGWLVAVAGVGSLIAAGTVLSTPMGIAIIAGVILILAGLIGGSIGSRVLIPNRIDKHFIWLNKVSPAYLATFPDANI